jgi:hypothetical protein
MERFPDLPEFWKGVWEFRAHEKRDAMYKVATRLIETYWGKHEEVAEGLGVLLLTWNQACYRYGSFDFEKLEQFLVERYSDLSKFRGRNILSWNEQDASKVTELFEELLDALIGKSKGGKLRRSPVAVSKALHLLAPNFFPLWDEAIAKKGYKCYWYNSKKAVSKYLFFFKKMKAFCEYLAEKNVKDDKGGMTLLKIIDEYNYSKYTKGWV